MGYEIHVEDDYVLLRVEPGAQVHADLLVEMLRELYALEAYRAEKKAGLWDFRGVDPEIRFEGMMAVKDFIAERYDPSWTHQYTAIVADGDVLYGLARMYESMTDDLPTELRIFRQKEEAVAWVKKQVA